MDTVLIASIQSLLQLLEIMPLEYMIHKHFQIDDNIYIQRLYSFAMELLQNGYMELFRTMEQVNLSSKYGVN